MKLAEAAEIWIEEKLEIERREARRDAAAEVLKAHFERNPKRSNYKGLIGSSIQSQLRLDIPKAKAELGDRLPSCQKRITYRVLTLLQ